MSNNNINHQTNRVTTNENEDNENNTTVSVGDSFTKLGVLISSLMEFLKDKKNIHHVIKEQVRTIALTYSRASDELCDQITGNTKQIGQKISTPPRLQIVSEKTKKRSRDTNEDSPKPSAKKNKTKRVPNSEIKENFATQSQVVEVAAPSDWTTVNRKRIRPRKRERPDAMIISANGETTYAEILRKIKGDPNLQDFGKNVRRIRRTQKGELLLEINNTNAEKTEEFNDLVGKTLDGSAEIRTRVSETLIECKDIDEVTTEADICAALEEQLDISGIKENAVKYIRTAYGGTQIAKISLPDAFAQKALKMGKIRIGWSICRIREPIRLKRCFRCLEFGHIATECKNSLDRSNLCRKCGGPNHIAKECTSDPKCMFCVANNELENEHIAGSSKCPVFKKALSQLKR